LNTNFELSSLFPLACNIPAEARITPLHQRETLVGGVMARFGEKYKPVMSALRVRHPDGTLAAVEIGSYPLGGKDDAHDALHAATQAYDNGRGTSPTSTVAGRIACVEHFTRLMI
jgi:glyceraldehyde-3-phosphate dehydrogenase (NADP+)